MKYQNPVLTGFYPDPSICRVGEDYYLVNSTFEFFPGVVISHSKDLVHWEQIGHCISRNSQLKLFEGHMNNTGIFAPTIRYHEGIFYMVVTNVTDGTVEGGNFYMWTRDPAGEWSDPVFLHTPGIDPSFFFDDDGKAYYTGTGSPEIYLREIDFEKGELVGETVKLWAGTGGAYPEGPHLYKKNGWYYLLISEGGTERCHMLTMARSRNLKGPYEPCPDNPVMTNRSLRLTLESVGHADLVEDPQGNWWAVCLGTRPFGYPPKHNLGRETMLVPVDWSGDWPVFGDNGRVLEEFETDLLPESAGIPDDSQNAFQDDFMSEKMDLGWNYIYNPDWSLFERSEKGLRLHGNEKSLKDASAIAWIGRRQRHHVSETKVTLEFPCSRDGEEAGLTVFMNNRHHYEAALVCRGGARKLIFRRQIGSLEKTECELDYGADRVTLKLESDLDVYRFTCQKEDGSWESLGEGEVQYLTTEVGGHFTGNYIALYSCGNGEPCQTGALFSDFSYEGKNSGKMV